jgi:SAM-dependent methyltransferase
MKTEGYSILFDFEQKYWWHVGRRKILKVFLKRYCSKNRNMQILDIGCGTGANFETLEKYGNVFGLDNSEEAVKYCQKNNYFNTILGDIRSVNLDDNRYDLITNLDVLEHLDDDNLAVQKMYKLLKKDGLVIITVPAYNFLWSKHDIINQHKRRYIKFQLKTILEDNNFKIIKISYMVTFLAPLIILFHLFVRIYNKFLPKKIEHNYIKFPQFINTLFVWSLYLEAILIKYINFPFGISIVCVAQKQDS